jgi:t-SNARE complex subunit (syntaxin)
MDQDDLREGSRKEGLRQKDQRREEIARLEDAIENLAATIESCRKIIFASKAAIAGGGLLLVAMTIGVVGFEPTAFMAAIVAVLGGTVLFGSNRSTSGQATAALQTAEARRAQLIGEIDLTVVDDRPLPRLNGGTPSPLR